MPGARSAPGPPLDRSSIIGRAVLDRRTIHVEDTQAAPEGELPVSRAMQQSYGYRTALVTPLPREGAAIDGFGILRYEVRHFSERQIKLLKMFAA